MHLLFRLWKWLVTRQEHSVETLEEIQRVEETMWILINTKLKMERSAFEFA